MVSELFLQHWNYSETIKNEKLQEIIWREIIKIKKLLKKPEIKKSTYQEDTENGIDYVLEWDIPLAFRGRRVDYNLYASKQKGGSFTLRETGENGGKAEIYKMIEGNNKSKIYVFVWQCGSYAVIDIPKWIKSGLLQEKLKGFKFKNTNKKNQFVSFTYTELNKYNAIISFYNAKQKQMDKWIISTKSVREADPK